MNREISAVSHYIKPEKSITTAPILVNWALTNRCNFSCSYCYSRLEKSEELSTSHARKIIKILVENKVLFLNLGGGEPLLKKDLFELVSFAKESGLNVTMNSNGYLLNNSVAHKIKNAGFNGIGISIDSHKAKIHDELRKTSGSHRRAIEAIRFLKKAGVKVYISSVVCRANFKEFEELVSFAKKQGVERLNMHNYKCSGMGFANKDNLDLTPDEWGEFYQRALDIRSNSTGIIVALDDPILALLKQAKDSPFENGIDNALVKGSICGKLTLYLRANADVTPCGFIPISIGNLLKDDLKELWTTSPVLQSMRNKTPKGKCRKCKQYEDCWGGCTARAYALRGDFNAPDPHCWYNPNGSNKKEDNK